MAPRPTQKQVAEMAGVSQTVVSQVLNGQANQARINPETRARVQEAIQSLGYVPNAAARRLVGSTSSLIGVFTYEAVFPSSTRDFYAPFLEGIEKEASANHFDLLLFTSATGEKRSFQKSTRGRLALTDGTILLGNPQSQDRKELGEVIQSGHPLVFIGRRELPDTTVICVEADYLSATAQLTRRFIEAGHRNLLYLGATEQLESALDREHGFHLTAPAGNLQRIATGDLNCEFLSQQLERGITGFLIENDQLMRVLLDVASGMNLRLPDDFSAAVLGDAITGQPADDHWTRFEIPREEMGRGAVKVLRNLLSGRQETYQSYPCRVIEGRTLGHPPGTAEHLHR